MLCSSYGAVHLRDDGPTWCHHVVAMEMCVFYEAIFKCWWVLRSSCVQWGESCVVTLRVFNQLFNEYLHRTNFIKTCYPNKILCLSCFKGSALNVYTHNLRSVRIKGNVQEATQAVEPVLGSRIVNNRLLCKSHTETDIVFSLKS